MALTAITTLNIPGLTQTIAFNNPGLVDEIDFGNNQVTLKASSSYTLSKSDLLLYYNYLNVYNNALLFNFPSIVASYLVPIPVSKFNLKPQSTTLLFEYLSGTSNAITINYDLGTKIATFTARPSDVIITLQEFFMMVILFTQFQKQVSLN